MAYSALIIACVLLAIMAWIHVAKGGLASTKLSNDTPWGLYVLGFFYLAGIAIGMLCVVSICVMFLPQQASLIRSLAYVVGFMIAAGLLIVFDLGRPLRLPAMLAGNPASVLVWDLYFCGAVVLVSIWLLFASERAGILMGVLMFVLAVSAFMVHSRFFVQYQYAGQRTDRLAYVLDGLMNGLAVLLGVQLFYTGGIPGELILGGIVLAFARLIVELAHNYAPGELIAGLVEVVLLLFYKSYSHPAVAGVAVLIILIHGFMSKLGTIERFGATYPALAIAGRPRSYRATVHEYFVLSIGIIVALCIGVGLGSIV